MRNIKLLAALQGYVPEIEDVVDAMPKGKSYPWSMRNPDDINCIIIHHFASEASLMSNANFHINGRGWKSLGYHVVIDNGKIKQTNNLLHRTNHCSGYNERSIGVSIRGDLSKRALTDDERKLLYAAIVTLKNLFPKAVVRAHNECTKTSCPCTSIDTIRDGVSALENKLELELELGNNLQGQLLNAAALETRVKDLYGKAIAPGKYQEEAIKKLSRVADIMRSEGLL